MRGNIVGLLAVALMCVCGVARPSIIYTVLVTDGTNSVPGTITTDEAIVPGLGDITAWSLTSSKFGFTRSTDVGAGVACTVSGCGLKADSTVLLFDFVSVHEIEFFDVSVGDWSYSSRIASSYAYHRQVAQDQ